MRPQACLNRVPLLLKKKKKKFQTLMNQANVPLCKNKNMNIQHLTGYFQLFLLLIKEFAWFVAKNFYIIESRSDLDIW